MSAPALLRALRPKQWVKNVFVVAPAAFGQRWTSPGALGDVAAAFVLFCAMSSAVYLVNDVRDREADRLHPAKRRRPIAAGELGVGVALVTSLLLAVGALAGARWGLGNTPVTLVLGIYLVIQLAYSGGLKRVVVVDVLCIASGFVLRLLAGGFAVHVPQSQWILVCTIFLALFLALCKRRHEVVSLGDDAAEHRAILADYPLALLDQLIAALTAATIVGYTLYTVDERTARVHGLVRDGEALPWLLLTLPFVVYGLFRYLFLVHRRDGGGSPASTLARDLPSIVNGVLYVAASLLILRFAGT